MSEIVSTADLKSLLEKRRKEKIDQDDREGAPHRPQRIRPREDHFMHDLPHDARSVSKIKFRKIVYLGLIPPINLIIIVFRCFLFLFFLFLFFAALYSSTKGQDS